MKIGDLTRRPDRLRLRLTRQRTYRRIGLILLGVAAAATWVVQWEVRSRANPLVDPAIAAPNTIR